MARPRGFHRSPSVLYSSDAAVGAPYLADPMSLGSVRRVSMGFPLRTRRTFPLNIEHSLTKGAPRHSPSSSSLSSSSSGIALFLGRRLAKPFDQSGFDALMIIG